LTQSWVECDDYQKTTEEVRKNRRECKSLCEGYGVGKCVAPGCRWFGVAGETPGKKTPPVYMSSYTGPRFPSEPIDEIPEDPDAEDNKRFLDFINNNGYVNYDDTNEGGIGMMNSNDINLLQQFRTVCKQPYDS
jgi:hypothetical protein